MLRIQDGVVPDKSRYRTSAGPGLQPPDLCV